MVNEQYFELINKEIDGSNTPKESEKVMEYLSKNPDADSLYRDLRQVSLLLDQVDEVEPDPNLRKRILNSIPFSSPSVPVRAGFRLFTLRALPNISVAHSIVFGMGLALGICLMLVFSDHGGKTNFIDPSHVSGTIASMALPISDAATVSLPEVQTSATIRYSPELIVAELNVISKQKVTALLEFPGQELSVNSVSRSKNTPEQVVIKMNSVLLDVSGESNFVIQLNRSTQSTVPVTLRLYNLAGALMYNKTLSAGETGK